MAAKPFSTQMRAVARLGVLIAGLAPLGTGAGASFVGIDHCRDASLCSGPTVIAGSCASIPAMYGGVYGGYGGYGGHTCQCAPGFKDYDPATNTCTGIPLLVAFDEGKFGNPAEVPSVYQGVRFENFLLIECYLEGVHFVTTATPAPASPGLQSPPQEPQSHSQSTWRLTSPRSSCPHTMRTNT